MTGCPHAQTFVEKARQTVADSPVLSGDPEAQRLLGEARSQIYHWPVDFPGFSARVKVGAQQWTLVAPDSRRFSIQPLAGADPELQPWLQYHLGEMISHREHPKNHGMASKTGVLLGDWDEVYGRRVDFAGDKMSSYYRLKDHKITQISRRYGGQRFLICIERHHRLNQGWAAANYIAYYRDAQDCLSKVESYHDDYLQLGDLWLPVLRRYTQVEGARTLHRSLELLDHQLLSPQRSKHASR